MKLYNSTYPDLVTTIKLVYEPLQLICKNILQQAESQEYGACTFEIDNKLIVFRIAKTTPTKIGQFVTLWKRVGSGPIMPYNLSDPIDLFVISVRNKENLGQFVFPKRILHEKGFISQDGSGGKRAMRVYPPWNTPESRQAQKTQAWQLLYFFEIQPTTDTAKAHRLFL